MFHHNCVIVCVCVRVCDPLVEPLGEVGQSASLAGDGGAALLLQLGHLVQLEQVEPVSFLHGEEEPGEVTGHSCSWATWTQENQNCWYLNRLVRCLDLSVSLFIS